MVTFLLIIGMLYVSEYIIIALHELGHFICALIVRQKVDGIIVGQGKPLLHKKLFNVKIELNKLRDEDGVTGGSIHIEGDSISGTRGSLFLVMIGGVAMNVLVSVVMLVGLVSATNIKFLIIPLELTLLSLLLKIIGGGVSKLRARFNTYIPILEYAMYCFVAFLLSMKGFSHFDIIAITALSMLAVKSTVMIIHAIYGGEGSDGHYLKYIIKSNESHMTLRQIG